MSETETGGSGPFVAQISRISFDTCLKADEVAFGAFRFA